MEAPSAVTVDRAGTCHFYGNSLVPMCFQFGRVSHNLGLHDQSARAVTRDQFEQQTLFYVTEKDLGKATLLKELACCGH